MVWALPFSLATTKGMLILAFARKYDDSFCSSGYLDVSVPPVVFSMPMCSAWDT